MYKFNCRDGTILGTGNGDSLMLITFNPKTLNATILSIPRDSYVYIPNMGKENKEKLLKLFII